MKRTIHHHLVIASPAQPGAAIQLDCFVAVLLAMTGAKVP